MSKKTHWRAVLLTLGLALSLGSVWLTAQEAQESVVDEEIKMAALRGLRRVEPERALPVLEKFLQGDHSKKLKAAALSVLGRIDSPQAVVVLERAYQSETSTDLKKTIIRAFGRRDDTQRLLQIARNDSTPELRLEAIDRYGHDTPKASSEPLVQLYQSDSNVEIRKMILHALYIKKDPKSLIAVARQETDTELKKEAVRNLARMDSKEATEYLVELLSKN